MRKFMILLMITAAANAFAQSHPNTINAVIGDISYVEKFGTEPDESVNETERIKTHLSYVEALLRSRDVSHLSEEQQANRLQVIDLLNLYWNAGVFPENREYETRRPCFIDDNGNICAVGYLVEQTAGRILAEAINSRHKYSYLLDMNDEVVAAWAEAHGLTLEECAMIQPAYTPPVNNANVYNVPLKSSYGMASGLVGGFNTGMTILNLKKGNAGKKGLAYIGIASGTAQIIMGIASIRKDEVEPTMNLFPATLRYKAQNNLSYVNIAAGTTTLLTSAFNLWMNSKINDERTSVNLYSTPGFNNRMVAGVQFARRL